MAEKLKILDLFSGIGGFSLGLERSGGFQTVAFCEIEPFCQKVLKKHWPEVPIFEDVRTLEYDGSVDVITGGYPCQPFSFAGERKGTEDDRHLWPAMFSLIKKHRPTWVIGENVAGHVGMGLDDVLIDLGSEGYTTRTLIIPACAVDAKHRRDRLWIIAHTDKRCGETRANGTRRKEGPILDRGSKGPNVGDTTSERLQDGGSRSVEKSCSIKEPERSSDNVPHTPGLRIQRQRTSGKQKPQAHEGQGLSLRDSEGREYAYWKAEPSVGRVVDGFSGRVDRIKALGNAVVPQIPEMIGKAILESISNGR